MAITVNAIHVRRLIDQVIANLTGLQRDLHANAVAWKSAAASQSAPAETLAGWLSDAGAAYQGRLDWMTAAKADTVTWPQVIALWSAQGGSEADIDDLITPLQAAVSQLATAPSASYADIIAACDQITAAVDMPPSLWPE